ncbi:MAG TPA: PstS family phosphate ABC transporter substrate-binding protein [Dehalococcoidia bacterium]|nr:PstS family phosphate ABC transporter substrate-binding protein [Dehalococcoidia bacterium]
MNLLKRGRLLALTFASIAVFGLVAACGDSNKEPAGPAGTAAPKLSGSILIDGSSTVFPITEAVAEEFKKVQSEVRITVGISGTGGGFTRFCNGETAISDASRPITQKEIDACAAKGIEYIELPVAYDALSIVVNTSNSFASCITVAQLKTMWDQPAQGTVTKWNQVNPAWPADGFKLYGPGTDSGTFDYFTEHVNGKAKQSRADYTASEDDNVLVTGVAGDKNALGYFGLAYLEENKTKIKAVQVDGGNGKCVEPNAANVENGTYPLSRPLFVYVKKTEASKPEVKAFVDFYLQNAAKLSSEVGYVKFPDRLYPLITSRWTALKVGTMYTPAPVAGTTLEQLLSKS